MQLYDKQREEYRPATPGLGMFVEVKDPEDKVILAQQYGSEGRFTFTSHTPGEHQICLHSNSTKFSLFAGGMLVSRSMGDQRLSGSIPCLGLGICTVSVAGTGLCAF